MNYKFLLLLLFLPSICLAQVTYTKQDSLRVVSLLQKGLKQSSSTNLMLYYGNQLKSLPYVAHTLEVNAKEQLVVNLREMDCTTFVETVFALALTTKERSVRWQDYCRNLSRLRYAQGAPQGYTSRNHYFLWWIDNNKSKGLVSLPTIPFKYTAKQIIDINYMSTHSSAYKMLKGNSADIKTISTMEQASKGRVMYYIPSSKIGLSALRSYIRDGDILAIATKKSGLDTSHIGIASWGSDGNLHLLNASQIHKKVVVEPLTLYQYMKKHPTQLGIWVVRTLL